MNPDDRTMIYDILEEIGQVLDERLPQDPMTRAMVTRRLIKVFLLVSKQSNVEMIVA